VTIATQGDWTGLVLALLVTLLALVCVLALIARSDDEAPFHRAKRALRLDGVSNLAIVGIGVFWAALFLSLFFGLLLLIWYNLALVLGGEPLETVRTTLFAIAALTATLGAVVALPFTIIRIALTREQNRTAREDLVTDRLTRATEQLGHESPAVRMGAIHSLERIIRTAPAERELVLSALNAYIAYRSPTKDDLGAGEPNKLDVDVQAAVDVLVKWR
jgi:hypothetical protein